MHMGRVAREMLKESLDALISLDVGKAIAVIARDDEVDRMNVEVIQGVIARAAPASSSAVTSLSRFEVRRRTSSRSSMRPSRIVRKVR